MNSKIKVEGAREAFSARLILRILAWPCADVYINSELATFFPRMPGAALAAAAS
jgi:hypothetical protein